MRKAAALVAALVVVFGTQALSRASAQNTPAPHTIVYGETAKNGADWPIFIAAAQGYFAAGGLAIDLVLVGDVAKIAQQLAGGSLDVGSSTTIQSVEAIAGGAPMVNVITRGASSQYVLFGRKGLTTTRDLRRKTIIVGGPIDNTRVYADIILQHNGLKPADYDYVFAGNSSERFAALVSGAVDGAILSPPFSFEAQSSGYPVLDQAYKYLVGLPQDTIAANVTWAKSHSSDLVAFSRAYLQGLHFFLDRANRARCIQILVDATGTKPEIAAQTYDYLQTIQFFAPTGLTSAQDWNRVFRLLTDTNQMKPPYPPLTTLVDASYVQRAAASLPSR